MRNITFKIVFSLLFLTSLNAQHSLRKLPYPINSDYHNELCPIISSDDKSLYYTKLGSTEYNKTLIIDGKDVFSNSTHEEYLQQLTKVYNQISQYNILDPVHSAFNQDVYVAMLKKETVTDVFHPGYPLNNALPNSICSVFGDENEFLVLNEFDRDGSMVEGFSSVKIESNHNSSFPSPIRILNFKQNGQNINANLSIDKQHLFLSMYDAVADNKQLYLSIKMDDTTYAAPIALDVINTDYEEITPFISKDKTRLYFSSNRPGGNGEYDIYYVERLDYSYLNWSIPKSLNPPLNTVYSENYPYVVDDEIYFVSDRDGTSDIFKVKTKRTEDNNINITVHIKATKEDGSKFPSEIMWGDAYNTSKWKGYFRAKNGEHTITINKNEALALRAENRNLVTATKIIDPQELYDQGINEVTVHLFLGDNNEVLVEKIEALVTEESIIPSDIKEGSIIILNNIYFKRATSDVLTESFPAIQKLANVLLKKKQLVISIDGHTDNVGNKDELIELSEQRAITIKEKLVEFGVNPAQILTKGYGSDKPLNDNGSEEKKQQNRRVEITVLRNQ